MDFNSDWYERYQAPASLPAGRAETNGGRKQRQGVRVSTLIACMLATMLIGCAIGGVFTKVYVDRSVQALSDSLAETNRQTAAAAAEAQPALGEAGTSIVGTMQTAGYSKAQIIELCAPSVVGVNVSATVSAGYGYGFGFGGSGGGTQQTTGSGSGIVLTADGYIVTCKHVVDGAETVTVILNDDTEHEAQVIGSDSRNDLAVLKIDAAGLTPATLGDSDMLTVGEDVIAIGNPLGELRGTSTSGIISALDRDVTVENMDMTLLQTDAAISPGNSGGGLFNASGSLIGIVNAKANSSGSEGLGFAIPVNSVKQIISDLMVHGYVRGRAYLGVYTQNVTLSSGQNGWGSGGYFGGIFGDSGTACVQVARIVENSAAAEAGLQVGDLIRKVDEQEITSNAVLSSIIAEYDAGDSATLTVQRGDEELTVSVTFGEYSPNN